MPSLPIAAGVGLRTVHLQHVLTHKPATPWFELLLDNWLAQGGFDKYALAQISDTYPIAFHGVNLSLGGTDNFDYNYLGRIKTLLEETGAIVFSEHCSFAGTDNLRSPDLLPMPYTDEAIMHMSKRIKEVQEVLERRIMVENVSCYIECHDSAMKEYEFIAHVVNEANCDLLLDLNNLYVNSVNHSFCANQYIQSLPLQRIKEVHLAGYQQGHGFLLDCHNNPVAQPVWHLYESLLAATGPLPTLIEWDNQIPPWQQLEDERRKAQRLLDTYEQRLTA